ncbi:MAG TPA: LysE family transporter [Hyphomicrobium sp.]|nr:LysE family transporter [Hyphomicrobium sp.]HRO50739.1 LysE family transporter [Hyphomicrobium sp.]
MEPAAFVLASLTLLATPGPTNTLLATSGAGVGVRRSLPLLVAEFGGYVLAISLLIGLVGPVVAAAPIVGTALRLAAALYLLYLAAKLWQKGVEMPADETSVTFVNVFVTTLLNPKAIIFAFTLLPADLALTALAPWMAGLSFMIAVVGNIWIAVGASFRRGFAGIVPSRIGYRVSAVVLALLAGSLSAHAFGVV